MDWESIRAEFELSDISLKDLAEKHGIKPATLRSRKNREKWQKRGSPDDATQHATQRNKNATQRKNVATRKKVAPKAVVELVESDELNEQQKTFCLLYLKYKFNQTKAYREAYGCDYRTAHANSYRMMANDGIRKYIKALKLELRNNSFIDIQDIIAEYEAQFSADITDYIRFGKKEIEVTGPFGPIKDEDGDVIMKEVNYVDFVESNQVDGTLIKAVRMGKDGPVVELYDKQKAMSELMKYLGTPSGSGEKVIFVDSEEEMLKYMEENSHEYNDIDK